MVDALTVYLSIIAQHHPDRVPGLFGYQHRILNAHQQFRTESMLNDTASRSFYIAEEPHARWNQVNTTLWSTKMLQRVCLLCPQCTNTHSADHRTMHRTSSSSLPFHASIMPAAGQDEACQVCLNFNCEGTHAFYTPVDHTTLVATAEGTVTEHTNANGRSHQTTASSH